ncbi:hypothetical protein TKK_0009018 [Trichogramma kaykai]|uniref:Uncharacterized protein n=1 Tax=Trichogramma kaykai TaxID=54128 RepID=A0ABD2X3Y6_9HYME
MAIATQDLLEAISDLTTIREMKVALNVSTQCGLIVGATTFLGGLLGGPTGIAAGGILGTFMSSYHANGKFKSVPEILATEATPAQKEKLAEALKKILTKENIFTLVQLAATIQSDRALLDAIQNVVRQFVTADMGYKCIF